MSTTTPGTQVGSGGSAQAGPALNHAVIAIIGPSRCGKDTVARMLAKKTGLKFIGSVSWFMKEHVASLIGEPVQVAWETRHENRELWRQIIDEHRAGDPSKIIREMLGTGGARIISGIRVRAEFEPVKHLFTHIIWVERPGTPVDPTLELTVDDCTHLMFNNGSVDHLESFVGCFCDDPDFYKIQRPAAFRITETSAPRTSDGEAGGKAREWESEKDPEVGQDARHTLGPWVKTWSGLNFDLLNPQSGMIRIEDIAHALSKLCRWTGHCSRFYSVAAHSIMVSNTLEESGQGAEAALAGLLHDAAEAYIGDINNPIKRALRMGGARSSGRALSEPTGPLHGEVDQPRSPLDEIEWRIKDAIAAKFGVDFDRWKEIGIAADLLEMSREAWRLMPGRGLDMSLPAWTRLRVPNCGWMENATALLESEPSLVAAEFLKRFEELKKKISAAQTSPP